MLDDKVFEKGMVKLKSFYPTWKLDLEDGEVLKAWYEMFNNVERMDDEGFNKMIKEYIAKERYNPSVAGLMEHFVPLVPRKPFEPKYVLFDLHTGERVPNEDEKC